MAGYTRQSSSSIASGQAVSAVPLNNEFNQVQSAFDASSGHNHDGSSAGNGPKIVLTTSISGFLPLAHGGIAGKNQVTTSNPAATNDTGEGYAVGSFWGNSSTKRGYIAYAVGDDAAEWKEIAHINKDGNAIDPGADNTVDLGTNSNQFKDLYINGTANIDALAADAATVTGAITGTGGITSFPTYQASAAGTVSASTFAGYANKRVVLGGSSAATYTLPDAVSGDLGKTWIINNASSAAITLDVDTNSQTVTKLTGSAAAVTTDITIASGGVAELICTGADSYILYGSGIA